MSKPLPDAIVHLLSIVTSKYHQEITQFPYIYIYKYGVVVERRGSPGSQAPIHLLPEDAKLQEVFHAFTSNGANWFDTGDSYGTGELEGGWMGRLVVKGNGQGVIPMDSQGQGIPLC